MMSIRIFLTVFIAGVALALVLETVRKRRKRKASVAAASDYTTANEALPTQTGKYRVQAALKSAPARPAPSAVAAVIPPVEDIEAEKLPDPFQIDLNNEGR